MSKQQVKSYGNKLLKEVAHDDEQNMYSFIIVSYKKKGQTERPTTAPVLTCHAGIC